MSFAIATATTDAHAAINARVSTWWVTDCGESADTLRLGNTGMQAPVNAVWTRATIIPGESDLSIGILDQKIGVLQVDIYGPRNEGAGALLGLADKFKARFQRQNGGGIQYFSVDGPRELPDTARARVTLRVRYQYSEDIS